MKNPPKRSVSRANFRLDDLYVPDDLNAPDSLELAAMDYDGYKVSPEVCARLEEVGIYAE